jgi:hypothetical protein
MTAVEGRVAAVAAAEPSAARLAEIIGHVHKVPEQHRRFNCDAWKARSQHGVRPELLRRLVDAGLPRRTHGGVDTYDGYDIGNIALHLGLSSVQRVAVRSWGQSFARTRRGGRYTVDYVPTCPTPGHSGPCRYRLHLPGRTVNYVVSGPLDAPPRTTVALKAPDPPRLPAALVELCAEIAALRFFLLPEEVRWDVDFMRSSGLADCGGSSMLLLDGAQRLGIPVRLSFGLLLAVPFATPHFWAEIRHLGRWIPLDPLLVAAMRRWSASVPADVAVHCPPVGMLARVGDAYRPLADHDGLPARLSFVTEYHPDTGEHG